MKNNSSFQRNYHHSVPRKSKVVAPKFLRLNLNNYEYIINTPLEIITPHFGGVGTLRSWYIITFVRQHLEHQIHFSARVFFNGPAKNYATPTHLDSGLFWNSAIQGRDLNIIISSISNRVFLLKFSLIDSKSAFEKCYVWRCVAQIMESILFI